MLQAAILVFFLLFKNLYALEQNVMGFDPVSSINGMYTVFYERGLEDINNCSLGTGMFLWDREVEDWKIRALGISAAYHSFPDKNALKGLFWGPRIEIIHVKAEYSALKYDELFKQWEISDEKATNVFLGFCAECGYRWILPRGVTLDFSTGLRYLVGSMELVNAKIPITGMGWTGVGVNVGYCW